MRTAIVALAVVFSLAVSALAGTGDTNWMSKGKFGIFMHYQYRIREFHRWIGSP